MAGQYVRPARPALQAAIRMFTLPHMNFDATILDKGQGMTRVFHRQLVSVPPLAVLAKGVTITDHAGRTYIDDADVSCLGHNQPYLLAAMTARRLHERFGDHHHVSDIRGRGLMVYPMGGTIDGARGDHVLLAPPFICDEAVIGTIVERLGEAVDAAIAQG
jgi:adenosylmethionine-8-amino-7-oxononanoate aminotransferase